MTTPGLSAVANPETSTEEKEPSSGSAGVPQTVTKGPRGINYLSPKNTLVTDPTSQASILDNMQKFITERERQQNSLLSALNYASLYGSGGAEGPGRALLAAEEQNTKTAAEIFNMKQAIAQQRSAQTMQQDFMKSNIQQGWLGMPAQPTEGGAPATGTGGVQAGGGANFIPTSVAQQFFDIAKTEGIPAANKFKSQYIQKQQELETQFLNNKASYERDIGIIDQNGQYELVNAIEARNRIKNGTAKIAPEGVAKPTTVTEGGASLTAIQNAIAGQEWTGDKDKAPTSKAGAVGPSQITPDTWTTYTNKGIIPKEFKIDDPDQNMEAGKLIIADLYKKHKGNVEKIAAEYYGGPGAIDKDGTIKKDVAPKAGIPGPNVGEYVDQVKNRIGGETVTEKKPTTFAETKRQFELDTEAAKQDIASGIKSRDEWLAETKLVDLADQRAINRRVVTLIKDNPNITGVFADPGVKNALLNAAEEGMFTPLGHVRIQNLQETIFTALADTVADVSDRRELASYLARNELKASRLIQGQGQVSEQERDVIRRMSGSIKDPAELIYKRARIMDKRNEFDQATRQLYEKKGFRSLNQLRQDSQYQSLLKAYEKDLDTVYNEKVDFSANRVKRTSPTTQHPKDIQDILNRNKQPKKSTEGS
jgi:hypothetical protein